jgi:hypothetical protein
VLVSGRNFFPDVVRVVWYNFLLFLTLRATLT